jgi:hypothetical protein
MKELHIERQQLVKHVGSIANLRVLSEMFRCWYRIASEKVNFKMFSYCFCRICVSFRSLTQRARHHQLYTSFYRSHALMRCKRQWELFMLKSRFRHARAEAARMFESRQHRLFVVCIRSFGPMYLSHFIHKPSFFSFPLNFAHGIT